MNLYDRTRDNLLKRNGQKADKIVIAQEAKIKLNEELTSRDIGVAKVIGNYTLRLARIFKSAPDNKKEGLIAAFALLNQAQSLVEKDSGLARKLLNMARSIANVKEDE